MFKRILVANDGSPGARKAFAMGLAVARHRRRIAYDRRRGAAAVSGEHRRDRRRKNRGQPSLRAGLSPQRAPVPRRPAWQSACTWCRGMLSKPLLA
jgi:hypothetical protein